MPLGEIGAWSTDGPKASKNPAPSKKRAKIKKKAFNETDTCRICRGEGSRDEPLFHPCKCSGSIKYVHQECLMDWLSHSQKKHCELCKTPFRFTKLYDPEMPAALPLSIFLRHLFWRAVSTLVTWLRLSLVTWIWLVWLPWSMRACWWLMFWLADGAWILWARQDIALALDQRIPTSSTQSVQGLSVTPDTYLQHGTSDVSSVASIRNGLALGDRMALPKFLWGSLRAIPWTPWTSYLVENLIRMFGSGVNPLSPAESSHGSSSTDHISSVVVHSRPRSTLLSNFSSLAGLTSSPNLNKVIVDTLEGQIITIVVLVAFVLIFLIREWVVQQQVGIEFGGDPMGPDLLLVPPLEVPEPERQAEIVQPLHEAGADPDREHQEPDSAADDSGGAPDNGGDVLVEQTDEEKKEGSQILADLAAFGRALTGGASKEELAIIRQRIDGRPKDDADTPTSPISEIVRTSAADSTLPSVAGPSGKPRRPPLQSQTSSTASLIHRVLEENSLSADQHSQSFEILRLWSYANHNSEEFQKMTQGKEHNVDLTKVVDVLKQLQRNHPNNDITTSTEAINSLLTLLTTTQEDREQNAELMEQAPVLDDGLEQPSSEKGKQRALPASYSQEDEIAQIIANRPVGGFPPVEKRPIYVNRNREPPTVPAAEEDPDTESLDRVISEHQIQRNSPTADHQSDLMAINGDETAASPNGHAIPSSPSWSTVSSEQMITISLASLEELGLAAPVLGGPVEQPVAETPQNRAPAEAAEAAGDGVMRETMNWLWAEARVDDNMEAGRLIHGPNAPDPAAPNNRQRRDVFEEREADNRRRQDEAAQAAAFAAPDADGFDVFDDGDDFDGILELAGIRGPLIGLFQNALFSFVLLTATISGGIGLPYIWGKLVVLILANPITILVKLPLRWLGFLSESAADFSLVVTGLFISSLDYFTRLSLVSLQGWFPFLSKAAHNTFIARKAGLLVRNAAERLSKSLVTTSFEVAATDYPVFSSASHEALQVLKSITLRVSDRALQGIKSCFGKGFRSSEIWRRIELPLPSVSILSRLSISQLYAGTKALSLQLHHALISLGAGPVNVGSLGVPHRTGPIELMPVEWSALDRTVIVLAGDMLFWILGALYVRRGIPFSTTEQGKKVEGVILAALVQAGGVQKVILIISIEMIAFPLYCGMLLDLALLPLFDGASVLSRMQFSINSPWTSAFIHWFIGTCYMFHFALFVSLCRKILRPGVLYFVRDPDDPTFHPVRDVLEKTVSSQLRKIAFSALVYGTLVLLCLGSVVWGLASFTSGILPIHWSSTEPIFEFPVDLLFYNALVPFAVKFLKPSRALHTMYAWWFRKCARFLRLSSFLFGTRRADEEGHFVWDIWAGIMSRVRPKEDEPAEPLAGHAAASSFVKDGRFVRTPGNDQLRIPKGGRAFLEASERDDDPDSIEAAAMDRDVLRQYTKVYVPPWFGVRIGLLVFLIWIFAAVTGVGVTILPLLFGRQIFAILVARSVYMNDVYAFSIGIYILGGVFYGLMHHREGMAWATRTLSPHVTSFARASHQAFRFTRRCVRLLYAVTAFGIILPVLFAFLVELYVIIPIYTYLPGQERHIIHLVQGWTVGVLYVKLAGRLILWYEPSRPARALRAVARHGWLKPDVGLATRFFILPATVLMSLAAIAPLPAAWLLVHVARIDRVAGLPASHVYRYSYPALLALAVLARVAFYLRSVVRRWRMRIRDDAYLIGERLHNLGEARARGRRIGRRRF